MSALRKKKTTDSIDIQLGKLLRLARNACGMSQEQLATMTGLTFQQIQKYEHGDNRVSVSRLMHMATHLGISATWFVEKLSETSALRKPTCETVLEILNKREAQELLRSYANIENKNERQFLRRITALLATQSTGDADDQH